MLHDISAYIEEVTLIFNRDQSSLCSIIFGHLEKLG